jgi:hypothetical protein
MCYKLHADNVIGLGSGSVDEGEHNKDETKKYHVTLKQTITTRWNSVLNMIDSILCIWNEMSEALKEMATENTVCLNMTKKY